MMLKPSWIKSFKTLAEVKNFTRAAESLDLTQAAVSQHIQRLEAKFGRLIIRSSRQLELTPKGFALLDYCVEVENAEIRLKGRLSEHEGSTGKVGVICPGSLGLRIYPLLLDLQTEQPELKVCNRFAPDSEVIDAVVNNKYEIGFTSSRPDDPRLTATPFCQEALELIVPAGRQINNFQELVELGFIDHPDGKAMVSRVLSRLYPNQFSLSSLTISGYSNQIGLILDPVARGLGFTVLPSYARQAYVNAAALHIINLDEAYTDTLWLVYRSEWPLMGKALQVIEYLREKLSA